MPDPLHTEWSSRTRSVRCGFATNGSPGELWHTAALGMPSIVDVVLQPARSGSADLPESCDDW